MHGLEAQISNLHLENKRLNEDHAREISSLQGNMDRLKLIHGGQGSRLREEVEQELSEKRKLRSEYMESKRRLEGDNQKLAAEKTRMQRKYQTEKIASEERHKDYVDELIKHHESFIASMQQEASASEKKHKNDVEKLLNGHEAVLESLCQDMSDSEKKHKDEIDRAVELHETMLAAAQHEFDVQIKKLGKDAEEFKAKFHAPTHQRN